MYQIRNLIVCSNVSTKKNRKNFNASDNFIKLVITSYILIDTPSEAVISSATEIRMSPMEELGAEDRRIASNDKVIIIIGQIG